MTGKPSQPATVRCQVADRLMRCPECSSPNVACCAEPHEHVCNDCGFDGSKR